MATDFVKLGWELTRKVKLTSPGCTVGLATHDGRMYGRGIVLGSHLGANRPAFRRAAVTLGRTGPLPRYSFRRLPSA
jgi:hypothetical protein